VVNMRGDPCRRLLISFCLASALVPLNGCALHSPMRTEVLQVKSRFLLTFDDGPSASPFINSTVRVLEHLARNAVQQDVKAIFFVQTRNLDGGGSAYGHFVLEREHAEGHILGLHSGTIRGHLSHIGMDPQELNQSLRDGMEDIAKIAGRRPLLVRPPYWWFNADTLTQYGNLGLHMMLSDVKAYDGVNWGMHIFRRPNLRSQLARVSTALAHSRLPIVDGRVPIIVTFHDTNHYTAGHLEEYLRILVEEAQGVGLPLDEKPFYDNLVGIMIAALERAIPPLKLEVPATPVMAE